MQVELLIIERALVRIMHVIWILLLLLMFVSFISGCRPKVDDRSTPICIQIFWSQNETWPATCCFSSRLLKAFIYIYIYIRNILLCCERDYLFWLLKMAVYFFSSFFLWIISNMSYFWHEFHSFFPTTMKLNESNKNIEKIPLERMHILTFWVFFRLSSVGQLLFEYISSRTKKDQK